ncbi:MAG: hypothetical protein KF784_08505 [Fimbriimonadaceae bacterium]|nr:hypothetical protein [Fimbriimonadaceae bacterium]
MRLIHLLLATSPLAVAALAYQVQNAQVSAHTEVLQKAPSVMLTVTAQKLGGAPDEYTLSFSKPNLLKLESSSRTLVSDGTMVWDYDKKAKTYTEDAASPGVLKTLLSADNLWIWSAFFDADFAKSISSAKAGASRNLKGNMVKELTLTLAKDQRKEITFYIDEKLKVARGAIIKANDTEMIYNAIKLELGTAPLPAGDFTFTAPTGATKLDKAAAAANGLKYADVSSFFSTNCGPCHTQNMSGGLRLSSYQSIMRGGQHGAIIVPGDSKNSNLFKYLRAQGRPQMPPGGMVSDENIAKLEQWVDAGAKE